jgi:predicted methyltransferase
MEEEPWEKALSTASPPSVSAGEEVYITVWGLGYIM